MKKTWSTLKNIIRASPRTDELFLTIIDENGRICSTNSHMHKSLDLDKCSTGLSNFFDFLHPVHISEFQDLMQEAETTANAQDIELYIKNGHYHPMKWQVNHLSEEEGEKIFFCLGYKILDEVRFRKFNRLVRQHYQLIIEGLSGIIFHDKNGEIIAANRKLANIYNITLEHLYQLRDIKTLWNNDWNIMHEDGRPITFEEAPFMVALRTGQAQRKTMLVRLGNGELRWIVFNSQPLPDEDTEGDFAVVTSVIDVTNERELSHKLKDREALIGAFLQEAPHLAWVIDEDATLLFASRAFCAYFGLDEASAIGKKVTDLVPEAITNAVYMQHIEVLETGKPAQLVEHIKMADGSDIISHINIFPVNTISGKKLIGGQSISLPDKTRIEKDLRQAEERLLTISRATTDAIWEWDMQTGHIFRNDILMEMIGYQLDNSRGLSWWLRRIHPEDRNRVSDKVKEATDNLQQSWQDEYRFKCADGNYKHVRDKGFVVYENGLPVKMIGSLQDVSIMKALESMLDDERLSRQKDISEMVIKVQENERTRIGHELHDNVNQILSTAKLFIDMLNPSGKEQQQIKDKSTDYLVLAIEEIRKLSRDLVTPQLQKGSLADSIHALVDDISMAQDMEICFKHNKQPEQMSQGKKVTIFRIVQEQIKNILKHSGASKSSVVLEIKDGFVNLVISDNGSGFDPRQTHRGIGLSNIYERARFYNGRVDVQSSPGKGCTLTVSVPIDEDEA